MKFKKNKKYISIMLAILFTLIVVFQIRDYYVMATSEVILMSETTNTNQLSPSIINVTGVSLNKDSVTIKANEKTSLSATILPLTASNKNIIWRSANSDIAVVDENGLITGKSEGAVLIIAKTEDGGFTSTCIVEVSPVNPVSTNMSVNPIKLNKYSLLVKKGKSKQINPIFTSKNKKDTSLTWKSSDTSVATVNTSGKILGLKEGTSILTVKTLDGKYFAQCTVYVTANKNNKNKDNVKAKKFKD